MVPGPPLAAPPARLDAFLYKLLQLTKQNETLMTDSAARFGFVAFAETWNGRLAMLGFVIGLGTELLTGQGILSQIGLG
jgi:ferrochelatase